MSKTEIRSEINGSTATLTFSTPGDRVNALTPDLLHSFGAALARLKQNSNVRSTIVAAEGRVFLAGADIKEFGPVAGLDIAPGRVIKFAGPAYAAPGNESGLKVPHMGWNQIKVVNPHPVVADLPTDAMTYFVHSYYPVPDDPSWTVLTSDHGCEFNAAVGRGNLFASQFHPEKSGAVGLKMLTNFVGLVESVG